MNFRTSTQEAISSLLAAVDGVVRVRVNFRRNVVAADVPIGSPLEPLLAITDICGISVRARRASNNNTCSGIIFGVDTALGEDDIRKNIASDLPVTACSRSGKNLIVRFEGTKPPAEVSLYKQRRTVKARRPRPVQCDSCGRYGHVQTTCTFDRRCLRCGADHEQSECTAPVAKCLFCGGKHIATEPRCPRWQKERQLAEARAQARRDTASQAAQTHGAAKSSSEQARVFQPTRQGLLYSSIAGGSSNNELPASTPADPSASARRDSAIAVLAAAVRTALEFLPPNSPAHSLCVAALATQQALNQHG